MLRTRLWQCLFSAAIIAAIPVLVLGAPDTGKSHVMKFDFGPKGQQVLEGFTGVDSETAYTAERGYGFVGKPRRAVAGRIPDPLTNDSVQDAVFEVDLPNGSYEVGIWTGYLQRGGNYVYSWSNPHVVTANSVSLLNLTITPEIYQRALFFKCSDVDVTPSTDIWKTFIEDWFPYKQDTVAVNAGKLRVGNSGNAYLNGLIICPSVKKAAMEKELVAIGASRRRVFSEKWLSHKWAPAAAPEATAEERQLGYVLFQPDTVDLASPTAAPRPEQRALDLRLFAARGEYKPATLAIFPLDDAGRVSVSMSDLKAADGTILPGGEVDIRLVRMYVTQGPTFKPFYMVPANQVALNKSLPRQFWFTLHVPEDAKPGFYRAEIVFSSERGTKRVPVLLRVLDLTLPDVTKKETGAPLFQVPYNAPKWYLWLKTPPVAEFGKKKGEEYFKADLQFMRERGLSPSPTLHFISMAEYYRWTREAGYTIPIGEYGRLGGPLILDWRTNLCPLEKSSGFAVGTPGFNKALTTHLDGLLAQWRKEGVPPGDILFNVSDEVGSHLGAKGVKKLKKILQAVQAYGKVRTIVFANAPVELELLPWADWFVMTYYGTNLDQPLFDRIRGSNAQFGVYSLGLNRLAYGFYLWRTGARMHWCWHYFAWSGAAYNTVASNSMGYLTVPGVDGPLPTIRSEAVREGIDDYRYILALDRLIAQAEKSQNDKVVAQLRAARETRAETWEFVDPNYERIKASEVWKPEVYGKLRWRIARTALKLQAALRQAGETK